MGSDLYMEAQNFRPRKAIVEWDGNEVVVKLDTFYSGYEEKWRGTPDDKGQVERLVFSLTGQRIPKKPEPVLTLRQRLERIVNPNRVGRVPCSTLIDEIIEAVEKE